MLIASEMAYSNSSSEPRAPAQRSPPLSPGASTVMGDIHGLSRKQMTRGAADVRSGVRSGSGCSAAAAVTSNRLHRRAMLFIAGGPIESRPGRAILVLDQNMLNESAGGRPPPAAPCHGRNAPRTVFNTKEEVLTCMSHSFGLLGVWTRSNPKSDERERP